MKTFKFDIAEPIAGTQWFHATIEAETQEEANAKILDLIKTTELYDFADYGEIEAETGFGDATIYDDDWNEIDQEDDK